MTKLEIINAMLASIGQMPVSSDSSSHPFAITASNTLEGVNREVQSEGWWFNKDYSVTLLPNAAGNLILPNNVLSADASDTAIRLVQRNGRLYDPINQTDVFTDSVKVDLISLIDIEYLPTQAAAFIKRRSIYEYFLDRDGEAKKLDKLQGLMENAWTVLNSEKIKQADTNIDRNPVYRYMMSRFSAPEFGVAGQDKKIWVRK
jgi:hypothetical protein